MTDTALPLVLRLAIIWGRSKGAQKTKANYALTPETIVRHHWMNSLPKGRDFIRLVFLGAISNRYNGNTE